MLESRKVPQIPRVTIVPAREGHGLSVCHWQDANDTRDYASSASIGFPLPSLVT
jgi:hypothetical protein